MDHVAIMNKRLGLISKILDHSKAIESRWYKKKVAPWDKVKEGDTIYFKNSGQPITAKAFVSKVMQFDNLNLEKVKTIVDKYGGEGGIALVNKDYQIWAKDKKYCILIFLEKPQRVKPFSVSKAGFGIGAAWMCVEDINKIKKP